MERCLACEAVLVVALDRRVARQCMLDYPAPGHRAGLFAGAACCDISWSDEALKQILRGRLLRTKAAPLRALGTNIRCQRATLFEDEDDPQARQRYTGRHPSSY